MLLGIYGAGGLGREILELALQVNAIKNCWSEFLFIDDAGTKETVKTCKVLTFAQMKNTILPENIEIIVAVGEPDIRRILSEKISQSGYLLATLIHPNVHIPVSAKIGKGVIIGLNSFISCDIIIENNVLIQPLASIGHDTKIGQNTVISCLSNIAGACVIGANSYIAMSVCIKEKMTVGNDTIVGVASAVLREIPDGVIAMGNPARVIKLNEQKKVFG